MADPFLQQNPQQQQQQAGQGAYIDHTYERPAYGAPGDWAIPASDQTPLLNGYNWNPKLHDAAAQDRMNFVQKVYGILTAQLLLTFAIAMPIAMADISWIESNQWMIYISYFGLIIMLCAMVCFQPQMREFPTNYAFLGFFTVCMAILAGFVSAQYTWQSVTLAVAVTAGMFLLLTCYACTTKTDFTGYGPYLFAACCGLVIFGLLVIILGAIGVDVSYLVIFLDVVGVIVFTFYIIFDTQLILGGKHENQFTVDDYAFASLSLYLDIMNLFLYILSLLGDRK